MKSTRSSFLGGLSVQLLAFTVLPLTLLLLVIAFGSIAMHQTGILNLANRLYGGAVTNTVDACRLMAGEPVPVWMVEGSVPLRYSFADAGSLYDSL